MKLMGVEFEEKINQYINENISLKNQMNHLKA